MENDELNLMSQEMDDECAELAALFGQESELEKMEKTVLTQNLDGFASCFPEWDLHPPVGRR